MIITAGVAQYIHIKMHIICISQSYSFDKGRTPVFCYICLKCHKEQLKIYVINALFSSKAVRVTFSPRHFFSHWVVVYIRALPVKNLEGKRMMKKCEKKREKEEKNLALYDCISVTFNSILDAIQPTINFNYPSTIPPKKFSSPL